MNLIDPHDTARNLLFGLLAFQLNFIDRRALLNAFDAWTGDKSRPLGRILSEQGVISGDLLALVDALVTAHISRHGGHPEKSLAALTSIGSVRDQLEAVLDPEARATLALVSADRTADYDPADTKFPFVGSPTSAGVRFRVLRPLSAGGMGVVSVALDTELDRSIALKEIRETAADDAAYRARFLAEAEITGKLEHPGIIPIYGLGTYADGRPFYAMRLIRGDKTGTLMDAIKRFHAGPGRDPSGRAVAFRGLLGRFLDVCNALAYAHSKGVLHRDLKPDNILLGPFGETLVVDWGLAKAAGRNDPAPQTEDEPVRLNLSGSELSPTVAGGAFGTPGYAPPEQMTGDLANVGTRSDVYGLGAILYCLMTGQAPFSRKGLDLGGLIRKIEEGRFPPPRQVRADIDKSLEAICLRAMGRKPADRYESVRAMAGDVERYLADEPVMAYREPWGVKARRWTKKHRTAVTATVAAMVVALVGLGAVTAVQTKARNDLAGKNGELTAANRSLDQQRLRAEANEVQAIAAVERFGDTIRDDRELRDTPALKGLRSRVLKGPLEFFRALRDRLQASHDTRPESLARLAKAAFRLADLTSLIGDKRDALTAYRESLAIRQKLAEDYPNVVDYRRDLATSCEHIGDFLYEMGESAEAKKIHEMALAIRRKLADAQPTDAVQSGLAASQNSLGTLHLDRGELVEAEKAFREALAIRRKLADAHPRDRELQNDLAASYYNLGRLRMVSGEMPEAREALNAAISFFRKLAEAQPDATEFRRNLAIAYHDLGVVLQELGDAAGSMKAREDSLKLWVKLSEDHPSQTEFRKGLALCEYGIGFLRTKTGQAADAMKSFDAALVLYRKLAEDNPLVIEFQEHLAATHNIIGIQARESGQAAEAMKSYTAALTIHRKLAKEHAEVPDFASDVGGTLNNMATLDLEAKRFDAGCTWVREAIEWQQKALDANPANPRYRQYMAKHLNNWIFAERGRGNAEGLAEAGRELAKFRESDPAVLALDARLAGILRGDPMPTDNPERLKLALRAYQKGLHASAARLWGEALAADPKLGDDRQNSVRYNAACAAALAGSGQGQDDPKPDDDARAKLRARALGWLGDDLAAWKAVVAENNEFVARTLDQWKQDTDLAGIRGEKEVAKLPESERKQWQSLWADVDSLLAEARPKKGA